MILDKAIWHSEGIYPERPTLKQASVHIGLFAMCAVSIGLIYSGSALCEARRNALDLDETCPSDFLQNFFSGVLNVEDFTPQSQEFVQSYYSPLHGSFIPDCIDALIYQSELPYSMTDAWRSFFVMRPIFAKRWDQWLRLHGQGAHIESSSRRLTSQFINKLRVKCFSASAK